MIYLVRKKSKHDMLRLVRLSFSKCSSSNGLRQDSKFTVCSLNHIQVYISIARSVSVQVLTAWLVYTRERVRKKKRIEWALEQRRQRLLRDGAMKWITVATDLCAIRQKIAIKAGTEVNTLLPTLTLFVWKLTLDVRIGHL